jgi:hypothetical protein
MLHICAPNAPWIDGPNNNALQINQNHHELAQFRAK